MDSKAFSVKPRLGFSSGRASELGVRASHHTVGPVKGRVPIGTVATPSHIQTVSGDHLFHRASEQPGSHCGSLPSFLPELHESAGEPRLHFFCLPTLGSFTGPETKAITVYTFALVLCPTNNDVLHCKCGTVWTAGHWSEPRSPPSWALFRSFSSFAGEPFLSREMGLTFSRYGNALYIYIYGGLARATGPGGSLKYLSPPCI